jgi:hypothetical protein
VKDLVVNTILILELHMINKSICNKCKWGIWDASKI